MKNLVVKTENEVIYITDNKVMLVKNIKTGRFMKVCPILKAKIERDLMKQTTNYKARQFVLCHLLTVIVVMFICGFGYAFTELAIYNRNMRMGEGANPIFLQIIAFIFCVMCSYFTAESQHTTYKSKVSI